MAASDASDACVLCVLCVCTVLDREEEMLACTDKSTGEREDVRD